jgi:hypothetical protein
LNEGTRRLLVRVALSLVLAAGFVWWLWNQGLPLIPPAEAFDGVAPWTIPGYAATLLAMHLLRAWRWSFLLRPVAEAPTRRVIEAGLIGYLAILVLPLRMGELARPILLKRHAGVPVGVSLGTIAVDRVLDGVAVSAMLSACLFTVSSEAGPLVWPLRWVPAALFGTGLIAVVVLLRRGDRTVRALGGRLGRLSPRVGAVFERLVGGFLGGLRTLPVPGVLARFSAVAAVQWALNAGGIYLVARGCGLPIDPVGAVGVMGILSVGILVPAGPGFFGAFQASLLVALGLFADGPLDPRRVAACIFLVYTSQVAVTFALAGTAAVAGRVRLRGVLRVDVDALTAEDVAEWS